MLTVEETYLPVSLFVPGITDETFRALCEQYDNYRVEYSAEGELLIMPPTDPETGIRNSSINRQLGNWAASSNSGAVTDSSTGFLLPNGARLSPDAAWISHDRLRRRPTCPEFVIELLSPSDRPKRTHAKMLEWIANGASLAWMIDPVNRRVSIYRQGQDQPEIRTGISSIEGEGPVAGFTLDLEPVWKQWIA